MIEKSFAFVRRMIEIASKAKKPASEEKLVAFAKPLSTIFDEIGKKVIKTKREPLEFHWAAFSEFLQALNWIFVLSPPTHIQACRSWCCFYCLSPFID